MPALFYHVTQSQLEEVAQTLLERALGQGWRIELRCPTLERAHWYDTRLWQGGASAFLPHGVVGGPHDGLQPVMLTHAQHRASGAFQAVLSVEGAEVDVEEIARHERVWIVFDGRDGAAVEQARAQWRQLTAGGAGAQYWSEDSGRWQMKAESKA